MIKRDYPSPAERFRILEALIFASQSPVRSSEMAEVTGWPESLIERDLRQVEGRFLDHGLQLQKVAGTFRLVTKAELSEYVEKLIGVQSRRRLSRAQLETLSVVAYRQPVPRAQVEAYRGVNCDRVLAQLSDLRLIREAGRAELPGRPYLFATTVEFLRYFGLESLQQLPDMGDYKREPQEGISASQAHWNASARGQESWDGEATPEPATVAAPPASPVAVPKMGTMAPIAEEISAGSSTKSLRKLLDKIKGRSAAQARVGPLQREEAS